MEKRLKDIEENTTRELVDIPKKKFHESFHAWKRFWKIYMASAEEYFGGD